MSNTNPTSPTVHKVVLNGAGPKITVKSATGSQVTVVNGTKVKTINLGEVANVEFAA